MRALGYLCIQGYPRRICSGCTTACAEPVFSGNKTVGEVAQLWAAGRRLIDAIDNEGRVPPYHRQQVAHLQRRWPTLWAAIQELRRCLSI